jgi:hypothetical protein
MSFTTKASSLRQISGAGFVTNVDHTTPGAGAEHHAPYVTEQASSPLLVHKPP